MYYCVCSGLQKISFFHQKTYYAVLTFILLSVFAGRTLKFYSIVPYWDKILHFASGFIAAAAGKEIYIKFGGNTKNPALTNLFIIAFAISIACVWEIYEFTADALLGTSSQNGSLSDTMLDIIAGTASALISILVQNKIKLRK